MHCPISRTKMIVITGKSNLLQSNNACNKNETDVFRNVSIVFPNETVVVYSKENVRNSNNVLAYP